MCFIRPITAGVGSIPRPSAISAIVSSAIVYLPQSRSRSGEPFDRIFVMPRFGDHRTMRFGEFWDLAGTLGKIESTGHRPVIAHQCDRIA